MIRVYLPAHLRKLARSSEEILVDAALPVTQRTIIDAVERDYPMLKGTIRVYETMLRRPFLRFFAAGLDVSHESPDAELPPSIVAGEEPFMIIGAIAGG